MSQIYSIAINDTVYELPSTATSSNQLQNLELAMQSTNEAFYEITSVIDKMNEVLSDLEHHFTNEIVIIKNDLYNLQCETKEIQQKFDCYTSVLEMELNDLRSALEEKTETSNQKSDLEIFSQIEWDKYFLNFGPSNIFLN